MKRKGQITIVGILSIVITLLVFGMTLPMQINAVNTMLNTTNDTTTRLIYSAFIPIEGLIILMGKRKRICPNLCIMGVLSVNK